MGKVLQIHARVENAISISWCAIGCWFIVVVVVDIPLLVREDKQPGEQVRNCKVRERDLTVPGKHLASASMKIAP